MPYKWESKNQPSSPTKPTYNSTDYDIPKFGYKSAFCLVGSLFLFWLIFPSLGIESPVANLLLGSLGSGYLVAVAYCLVEKKEGLSSKFWLLGLAWSVFMGVFLFLFNVFGVLM